MHRYLSGSLDYSLPVRDAHFCVAQKRPMAAHLAVIGDFYNKMSTEDKPAFLLCVRKYDPVRKAFRLGHALTSATMTIGFFGADLFSGKWGLFPNVGIFACSVFASTLRGADNEVFLLDSMYAKADEEYVEWRMKRPDAAKTAIGHAFCAGLRNGFMHNAASMTARAGLLGVGFVAYLAKELCHRYLFPLIRPSQTKALIDTADKVGKQFDAFYQEVKGYKGSMSYRNALATHDRLARQLADVEQTVLRLASPSPV